ncbi:Multidrug resistance protein [Phytophthora cactorum]|uniref:Multidrug resistance protein n=1 Tax=Phytophthora cactorum TaxID=29920 RepID=A0A8T1B991_9STRA|nr:Multidrug resistance protein [Phytophthora cactorum]KAG2847855.1 Multidrug resistance protein [Phytophthora cactorum]KAG2897002.1 Multidrug resistance protein [Phytophthora cactorum]KAG2897456.1 Multidrug resistance protein [Phytophthora cactorum]KAG2912670.1 Multidrug resistance protein [Phytophthora cactorum]
MRLNLKDEPLLDETMELPSLSVAPRPPHPRGGRGSFSSSYSSGFAGTDSLVSFNSSQLFDDSDDHEVDVDAMDSNSSRGDYALLSMPVESVKRMVPTTGVVTRSSNRTLNGTWNSQDCSFGRATAIADALRELREGRVAVEDEETEPVSVTLRQLVTRLSTRRDLFVMAMGLLAASIHGVLWALLARQVQSSIAAFTPYDRHDVDFAALTLMLLSLALGVTAYAAHLCLSHSSERLLRVLREQLLRHLLLDRSQSWFDSNKSIVADFGAELTRDSLIIRQGLGPELGAVCRLSLQFIGGFTVAFMAIWDLTLAISCVTPIIVRVITIVRQTRAKTDNEADAVATEALSNMQTVLALNAQRRVREKHALRVRITEKERVLVRGRHAALRATLTGTLWVSSAIGLWYGGKKVYKAEAEPGQVFGTFLGVIIGSHALGHLIPSFAALTRAKHACSELFTVLETPLKPHNNVMNPLPRPASCSGAIMAVDLHFSYPRRPDLQVLRGCNISLLSGECVAIVGDGGAGKSTLLMLLMRLYEPSQGLILLDGREANALDSTWMRAQFGLVPQHVTLFRASIFDNIAMGLVVLRDLTGRNSDRMEERVINAAQRADVHDFILSLPDGYNTRVGENGVVKLTAQQRQRIALARALIREPKLLLLDEVLLSPQELLSRFGGAVGAGSTTMLLCTSQVRAAAVQYADNIVVLERGKVREQGTHVELLQRGNSFYRRLHLIQHSAVREQYLTEAPAPIQQQQETRAALTSPTKLTKRDIKALSRPERQFLAFGLAASVIVGLGGPLLGVLISEMAADMVQQYSTYLESYDAVRLVQTLRPLVMRHGIFLGAGAAVIVVFQSVQLFCLDAAAERVASHLRDLHFSSLLAQPLAFFDQYNTKELVESLATQASTASLAVGRAQGYKLQIFCTLTTTFVLAFWSGSWMLTLVLLAALPLLLIGYSIHNQQRLRAPTTLGATEEAVEIHVNEALRNRRAVVILGLENSWCSSFDVLLQRPLQSIRRKARLEAVGKGFSAVVAVAACALSCWLGGVLEHYGDATFQELMRSLVVVIVSAESLGLAVTWLTRIDRALQAGANIFAIRDAAIVASGANEASTSDGERDPMPQSPMLRGSITFQNVCFAYSSRPSSRVLNGLSLHVAAGQTVALCGPRGAGMSTIFSLIEGFYDLLSASGNSGRVMLDGADMRALEVSWLRAQVSFVGSEPTLFLEGYATRVGGQLQLSPSQRQRIALARTVLEDARLLLLDEPTRSLGAESEKIAVQQALDTIVAQRVRRTTVIAAHPSESVTVRNADLIYVIQDGRVVNQGTHSELFQIQDGVYARLLQASTWSVASSNSYTVSLNTT